MAVAYQIEGSGDWVSYDAYPIEHNGDLYIRLYQWSGADEIGMYKSVDNGVNWSPVGVNFVPGGGSQARAGSGVKVGDIIYIPYQEWSHPALGPYTARLMMARFNMTTDTWSAPWIGPVVVAPGDPTVVNRFIHAAQCGPRSDGSFVICYSNWYWDLVPGNQFSRWQCVTVSAAGTFGTEVDITAYENVLGAPGPYNGPVSIDSLDTAHFIFPLASAPGWVHVSWTLPGVLSSPVIVGPASYFRNSVIALVSGVESLIVAGNPAGVPGVYTTPVSAISFTFTPTPAPTRQLQWMAAVEGGTTHIYASWPTATGGGGGFDGVTQGVLTDGLWGTPIPIEGAVPEWYEWTVSAMNAFQLGFVLGNNDDFTSWYFGYPIDAEVGTITVIQTTTGGDGIFNFTGTGGAPVADFDITTSGGTGGEQFDGVDPGVYVITQTNLPPGFEFGDLIAEWTGVGTSVIVDTVTQTATITMGVGGTVTITFSASAVVAPPVTLFGPGSGPIPHPCFENPTPDEWRHLCEGAGRVREFRTYPVVIPAPRPAPCRDRRFGSRTLRFIP